MHPLDRPVWASLTTHHVPLSEGNELARRFARDVNLFASARDDTSEAVAELARLVSPELAPICAALTRICSRPAASLSAGLAAAPRKSTNAVFGRAASDAEVAVIAR